MHCLGLLCFFSLFYINKSTKLDFFPFFPQPQWLLEESRPVVLSSISSKAFFRFKLNILTRLYYIAKKKTMVFPALRQNLVIRLRRWSLFKRTSVSSCYCGVSCGVAGAKSSRNTWFPQHFSFNDFFAHWSVPKLNKVFFFSNYAIPSGYSSWSSSVQKFFFLLLFSPLFLIITDLWVFKKLMTTINRSHYSFWCLNFQKEASGSFCLCSYVLWTWPSGFWVLAGFLVQDITGLPYLFTVSDPELSISPKISGFLLGNGT